MTIDQKLKAVTVLALEGKSAAQIAATFIGASRNAIIGFCHRKDIALSGGKGGSARSASSKREASENVVSIREARPRPPKPKAEKRTADVVVLNVPRERKNKDKPKHHGRPVNILNLTRTTCRAPLNREYRGLAPEEMIFCGEVTAPDSSWCKKCQEKLTTGRAIVKKVVDERGEVVKQKGTKRKPFHRWLR